MSKRGAFRYHNLDEERKFEVDERKPNLPSYNAAMPHRMSWADIRDNTDLFHNGDDEEDDFIRWTDRFIQAGEERIAELERQHLSELLADKKTRARLVKSLLKDRQTSQDAFSDARDAYAKSKTDAHKKEFLRQAHGFHANVPDLGPHMGVNNSVQEAVHLHFPERRGRKRRRPSIMSDHLLDSSPERHRKGVPVTKEGKVITTTGEAVDISELAPDVVKRLSKFPQTVIDSYDPNAAFGSPPPKKKRKIDKKRKKGKKKK